MHQSQKGRDHGQQDGGNDHHRGIVAGELGDEVLGPGFFAAGVFHQVQDLGHGGLLKGFGHTDLQEAGEIDAAGDHVVPRLGLPGEGFTGEGGGVQCGLALQHHAVQGHPLPCLDDDGVPHRHLVRVHLHQLAAPLYIGIVGPDIHQGGDGLPGLAHGVGLEELAHLIEEHDEHGLGVLADAERTQSGQRHQKVFIKDLTMGDVPRRPPQDVPADDGIGDQKGAQPEPALQRKEDRRCQQHGAGQNAPEGLLLLLAHDNSLQKRDLGVRVQVLRVSGGGRTRRPPACGFTGRSDSRAPPFCTPGPLHPARPRTVRPPHPA